MTLESDAKFEEKLTLDFKNDMRNLMNLNASRRKPNFCRKYLMFELKTYRGAVS